MEQNNIYTEQRSLQQDTDQEIDLVEIIRKLWKNRKFILRVTLGFMVLGVLVALLSSEEYTAGLGKSWFRRMGHYFTGRRCIANTRIQRYRENQWSRDVSEHSRI